MKLLVGKGRMLMWERHELGFSARTCFACPLFDEGGEKIAALPGTKRAGCMHLPREARWLVKRYFTNRGYPRHEVYPLGDEPGELSPVLVVREPEDVLSSNLPEALKQYLLEDAFGVR